MEKMLKIVFALINALSDTYCISFPAICHHSQDSDKNSDASCLRMLFILAKIKPEIHLTSLKAMFIIFISWSQKRPYSTTLTSESARLT